MLNIFKMDLHRLLHSKVFYVSAIFLLIMAVAMPMSGMATNMEAMMGATPPTGSGEDFLNTSVGTSVIFILIGITLTLFVCGDYSGGFAKNIFTFHSDAKDYIGGKMLSMAVTSGFLLLFYTIAAMIALSVFGYGIVLAGGVFGLIAFLIQKWLVSCAFIAVILLVNLFTRSSAVGIIAGFLVATGGLTMGLSLFGEMLGIPWLGSIGRFMVSGASQLCTLTFSGGVFVQVLLVSAAWMALCYVGSKRALAKKDV